MLWLYLRCSGRLVEDWNPDDICQSGDRSGEKVPEVISIEELKEWYQKLLDEYHKWLSYQKKWKEERNHSLQSLEFPFSYREGQRKMVSSVYHAIGASRQIFIQAPTGVGKTMSTIFPAVRAVGEGKGDDLLSYSQDYYKNSGSGSF